MKHENLPAKDQVPWKFSILFLVFVCLCLPSLFSQNYHTSLTDNISPHLRLNEISPVAYRHFRNNFKTVSDEDWIKDDNYFIARFREGTARNRVYYNLKGDFEYAMKSYGPELLNKELKDKIRDKFEGYTIKSIIEISNLENVVYSIKIESRASIKTLECSEGKIKVTEDYINAGL